MDEDDDAVARNGNHDGLCIAVAGIAGVLATLASPFAFMFGALSAMMFDSGSDKELLPWLVFLSLNALPFVLVWTAIFAFATVKDPSPRRLQQLFKPLGVLAVVFLALWLFAPS